MNRLREFLRENYDANPLGAIRFVNRTCRLVKIGRHWWRGRKTITSDKVTVTAGATDVDEKARTTPSWKLLPDKVKEEFAAFERSIDAAIREMCISGPPEAGSDVEQRLVFGNGVYAIDVAQWPTAASLIADIQAAWGAAADKWCTEDGYEEFHDLLKEQVGDTTYEKVKDLVPKRDKLRGRFWLEAYPLAFRLAEDVGEPSENAVRKDATVELIEAAVREPRETAAETWRGLAGQMVEVNGNQIKARRPERTNPKTGEVTSTNRTVKGDSVAAARRSYDVLARATRFHDRSMKLILPGIRAELPDDKPSQARVAVTWNGNDEEVVRVSTILLHAADAITDDTNMIGGVISAMSQV